MLTPHCVLGADLNVISSRYHQNVGLRALLRGAGRGALNPMMVGGRGLGAPPGFPPVDPAALRLQQQIALQQQVPARLLCSLRKEFAFTATCVSKVCTGGYHRLSGVSAGVSKLSE